MPEYSNCVCVCLGSIDFSFCVSEDTVHTPVPCAYEPWANPPRAVEAYVLITDLIIILI